MNRNRRLYSIMTIIIILLGLATRYFSSILPTIVGKYGGDILWAWMVFIIMGFLFNKRPTKWIALVSLSFTFLIEISQLYHGRWIQIIRNTTLGGLLLGYGFLWRDLLCYAIGIGAGIIMEKLMYKNKEI